MVSDGRRETDSGSAGHGGDGLDDDKIEGLAQLEIAFEELRSHVSKAWNSAMVWVEDKLVFTEMNMLMTVARDMADKVIEATSRIAREAQDEALGALDTRRQKSPSRVILADLLENNACGVQVLSVTISRQCRSPKLRTPRKLVHDMVGTDSHS